MRRAREGDAPVLGNARVDARELRERDERDEAVGRGQARVREVLRGGDGGGVRRLERREDWRRGCPRGSAGNRRSVKNSDPPYFAKSAAKTHAQSASAPAAHASSIRRVRECAPSEPLLESVIKFARPAATPPAAQNAARTTYRARFPKKNTRRGARRGSRSRSRAPGRAWR